MKGIAVERRWFVAVAAPLLLAALALWLSGANQTVFLQFNRLGLLTGDWLWSNITIFGDSVVVFCLLLPFAGRRADLIWAMMLAAIFTTLLVHGVKFWLDTPRPPAVLPREQLHLIGYVATSGSFPSGHTAAAFTLAGGLCLLSFRRSLKVLALSLAVLVGVARMAVGIHWPVDVVGGALVGWLSAAFSIWLAQRLPWGLRRGPQRLFAMLLLIGAALTCFGGDLGYPQARPLLVLLAVLSLLAALPGLRRLMHDKEK